MRSRAAASKLYRSERYAPYVFLAPTALLFLMIFLFPILFVVCSSFVNWNLLKPAAGISFVGFRNYENLLTSPKTWMAVKNTFVFSLVSVPLSMVFGMLLALAVDKLNRARNSVEAVLLIPMMVAPISIYLSFKFMFEPTYGIVNKLLSLIGVAGPGWFSSTDTAMMTVIVVELWRVVPFVYIVLYAALKTLPSDVFEAVHVDGANGVQTFWWITMPMLKPTLLVTAIIRLMDAIRAFDNIYVLTRGGPANATKTIQYLCYELAFGGFSIGKGSALAIIIVLIILITGMGLIRMMNRANSELM